MGSNDTTCTTDINGRHVLVAMSGGVDSSVAAALLREAGARVTGCHMIMHDLPDSGCHSAPGVDHAADARRVALGLGCDFRLLDMRPRFRHTIIEPFGDAYLAGRTPNPCVTCNRNMKLAPLLDLAEALGADYVATGHYARVRRNDDTRRLELHPAADDTKEQTYYLCRLTQPQLARLCFPLGELTKVQVKARSRELGLAVEDKEESEDICFVPGRDYRAFLEAERGAELDGREGDIVDVAGNVLGRHKGVHNYTVGQRKGLGLAAPRPLYVVRLDPQARRVVVGYEEDTLETALEARALNWVGIAPTDEPLRARVKIRYRSPARPATLYADPAHDSARIVFDEPQRAITPGQTAVAYDETHGVLLGATILRSSPEQIDTSIRASAGHWA